MKIKNTNRINLIGLSFVALAIVLGCKSAAEEKAVAERQARPAKFAAMIAEFSRKPEKVALVQQPYLKGKIVVLSSTDGKSTMANSPFAFDNFTILPSLVNTTNDAPEDVKTVILKECRSTKQGFYTTTENPPRQIPAVYLNCQMTIVDRTIQSVIFVKNFQAAPSEEVRVSKVMETVTLTPTKEMEDFLKSLPQR